MARDYTMTEVIASAKRRASVPTNQSLFDETKLVKFLSDEMDSEIVPVILSAQEDYFVHSVDTSIIAGTTQYNLPSRAINGRLKRVVVVDSAGNEIDIVRIGYGEKSLPGFLDFRRISGYWLRDGTLNLFPDDNWLNQTLRQYYFRKPNDLVRTSDAGKITAIVGSVVTVDNAPTSWTTSTTFDIIQGQPPFMSRGDDLAISAKSGADLTFSSLPSTVVVGDYVAEARESPIPQLPYGAFSLLAQKGAVMLLEALGDKEGAATAEKTYLRLEGKFLKIIDPRVEGQPQKVVSRKGVWRSRGSLAWPKY